MATKNVKEGKQGTSVDPFATVAEPSRGTAAPQKPTRAIKVIKAAKPAVPAAVGSEKSLMAEIRPAATDAFAELAKTPVEDEVTLELPARSQKRKPTTGAAKASTTKPKTTPTAVAKAEVSKTKRHVTSRKAAQP